ncbi:MAG: TetR/AcrR family transcriptional regulator [Calditrichaeota bacterium]|nr:TetR/AcrR family transcriptional regulator [Calditrichota bacterium]
MGIAERREREKEQRRQSILDAAEELFFGKGIEHTTMDDVAEAAEVSKGTLYLYFKNREDIYHGIYLRGLDVLKSYFEEALRQEGDGLCLVREIGKAYYRFSQTHSNYFHAMNEMDPGKIEHTDVESNGFKCHLLAEDVKKLVAKAVEIGIEDGSVRAEVNPKLMAYVLWGQTSGVIKLINNLGEHMRTLHHIEPELMINVLFDQIYHGLRTDK